MTNLERLLEQSKKIRNILGQDLMDSYENTNHARRINEIKDQVIAVMFEALNRVGSSCGIPDASEACRVVLKIRKHALIKIEQLAAQALGEK